VAAGSLKNPVSAPWLAGPVLLPEPGGPETPTPTTPDPHQPTPASQDAKARREHAAVKARRTAARAFAARTRAAQGLPLHVQDPGVIAELVLLFRPMPGDGEPDQHHGGEHLPRVADHPADRSAG